MWILVFAAYGLLMVYDFFPLYKQKLWRDFGINLALGLSALTVSLLLSLGVRIPSPEAPIRHFITSIFGK